MAKGLVTIERASQRAILQPEAVAEARNKFTCCCRCSGVVHHLSVKELNTGVLQSVS